ncbi:MAG: hypothetical protein ABI723_08555 [Bacteroidia bacterium]
MISKENCLKRISKFREKPGIVDATDENIISAIHLMNFHGLDLHAALYQSSRSANDNGIDPWFFDDDKKELFIYQSKLSEGKILVLNGLNDLRRQVIFLSKFLLKVKLKNSK